MHWCIVLLIIFAVWMLYPRDVYENFPSSVYDLVTMKRAHEPAFEETLQWNIYERNPPTIRLQKALASGDKAPLSSKQRCAQRELEDQGQQTGSKPTYCTGASANSASEVQQCVKMGGALIPCLCKDYLACLRNGGDRGKCETRPTYRNCMTAPNSNSMNC